MQRRRLLAAAAARCAGLMAAGASAPAWAAPAPAAEFAARAAGQPRLQPWRGVDDHTGQRDGVALQRGRWPQELRGRFYRNGPALFERDGQRYHHWFDGDGMVQQFTLGDGPVRHRGRLVQTGKLRLEREAGRFLRPAFGTQVEGGPPASGPDSFNTANTHVLEHGGRLLALWEGGSAFELDPRDLATRGPVAWRPDLAQMPFSAHPKVDAQGHLWNIGTTDEHLIVWHIGPDGRLVDVQIGPLPFVGGMVHDVAVTQRHLVVPLPPVRLNFGRPFGTDGASRGPRPFRMEPGEPLRVLVMEKADIRRRHVFELPAQAVFHVGHAVELAPVGGRGPVEEIELSFIGAPDVSFLAHGAVSLMRGLPAPSSPSSTQLARLNLRTGRARVQGLGDDTEFPTVHPHHVGQPVRWLLSLSHGVRPKAEPGAAGFQGLQLRDLHTGRLRHFDYGPDQLVEEHVWVPKPGSPGRAGERHAWLLGTTYDSRRQATVLNLLDAAHLEDGPLAQAVLPYWLPLGFHGSFSKA